MCVGLMVAIAGQAIGQEAASLQDNQPSAEMPGRQGPLISTLEEVRASPPDEEALDLYAFDNPIAVEPTRFSNDYNTGITPEEMALKYGGYVNYGINQGLLQTWKGIKKVSHIRPYEQPAISRPPPLSEEQVRRALKSSNAAKDEDALDKSDPLDNGEVNPAPL